MEAESVLTTSFAAGLAASPVSRTIAAVAAASARIVAAVVLP